MVQGTASSVGKSLLVTGLCRLLHKDGLQVAPFKAQNMSLNSFITPDGHEIGRAQAVQAEAAGLAPHVDMNPILLKPEADARSQVVLMGKPWRSLPAEPYFHYRQELWPYVTAALDRLRAKYEVVVIEGAGSPAEINLRATDITNMAVALYAQAPVLLVGDIDRGGVFAALLGTLMLISPEERALVRGLVINKFRGDLSLLQDGLRMIEKRSQVPVLGVVPYIRDLAVADEDSVSLEQIIDQPLSSAAATVDIAVIGLPHLSNFDDFDALKLEPGVQVRFVSNPRMLGQPQAVILPGSKNTRADLEWLYRQGLADRIIQLARMGTPIVGICGGYQMLGSAISDPLGVEGRASGQGKGDSSVGLCLLPVSTIFDQQKQTRQVRARVSACQGFFSECHGATVVGYEVHMGETSGGTPVFTLDGPEGTAGTRLQDGAVDETGRIFGTYIHGLFDEPAFRRAWLRSLGWQSTSSGTTLSQVRQAAYDRLSDVLRQSLDMEKLYELVGL